MMLRGLPVRGRLVLAAPCGTALLVLLPLRSTVLRSLLPPPLEHPLAVLEVEVLELLTLLLASASPAAMIWCAASISA